MMLTKKKGANMKSKIKKSETRKSQRNSTVRDMKPIKRVTGGLNFSRKPSVPECPE